MKEFFYVGGTGYWLSIAIFILGNIYLIPQTKRSVQLCTVIFGHRHAMWILAISLVASVISLVLPYINALGAFATLVYIILSYRMDEFTESFYQALMDKRNITPPPA